MSSLTPPPSINPGMFTNIVTALQNIGIGINKLGQNLTDILSTDYTSSTIASGSAVPLTSADSANVTSLSLVAGDWDVWGNVAFTANTLTTATIFEGGINTTSATLPTSPGAGAYSQFGISVGAGGLMPAFFVGMTRVNITTTTTVYLVANATFAINTMAAYGSLNARLRGA